MTSEIFGIVQVQPLTDAQTAGFLRIGADLQARFGGTLDHVTGLGFALGTLTYAGRVGAGPRLLRDAESGCAVAWAGCFSEVVARDVAGLRDAVRAGGRPVFADGIVAAACLVDESARTAWLVNDRYGLQPLHHARAGDAVVFCTKPGPLLRCGLVPTTLDRRAVVDFFTFEHLTGGRTLAEEVHLLEPGTILRVQDGRVTLASYLPTAPDSPDASLTLDGLSDLLYEGLSQSVARSLAQGGSPVAVTLSGGLDSRALLGCATRHRTALRAYTFGVPGCRDLTLAAEIARRCGVPHTMIELDGSFLPRWLDHAVEVTGGEVAASHFHILSLAEIIASECRLVLDGLSGDAIAGSHLNWRVVMARTPDSAIDLTYGRHASVLPSRAERERFFEPEFMAALNYDPRDAVAAHFRDLGPAPLWWGAHRFDLLERQRRFIQQGPQLVRPFVDVDTPFRTETVMEPMLRAPARLLLEQRAYVRMHARHLSNLAQVRDSNRGIPLASPPSLRFAKRVFDWGRTRLPGPLAGWLGESGRATTDYKNWLRTTLRPLLEERLLDGGDVLDGIVRRSAVREALTSHAKGADRTALLGCLLSLSTWLRSLRGSAAHR